MDPIKQAEIGNLDFFRDAEAKIILQARDASGNSVLTRCVIYSQLKCFKFILKKWPQLLDLQSKYGDSALTHAAYRGRTEFVKFLLDKRLFRMVNAYGSTPLHLAILEAHLDIVKILVEADPDFDSILANYKGETPQMLAAVSASAKDRTEIRVQINNFIIKKIEEKKATSRDQEEEKKVVLTAKELEMSVPPEYEDLYRRIVKRFGGVVPFNLKKSMFGTTLAGFLAAVAEMLLVNPDNISEEKLKKWDENYLSCSQLGLQIDWFRERIKWFRDWVDKRAKDLSSGQNEIARTEKQVVIKTKELSDSKAELDMVKAKLKNARTTYANFDFRTFD